MTGQLDINSLASWSTVLVAVAAAFGLHRKASKWLDSVDERFKAKDVELDDVWKAMNKDQAEVRTRLDSIDAQLRPNGGGSHHDVLLREVREAVREASDDGRGRRHWPSRR